MIDFDVNIVYATSCVTVGALLENWCARMMAIAAQHLKLLRNPVAPADADKAVTAKLAQY